MSRKLSTIGLFVLLALASRLGLAQNIGDMVMVRPDTANIMLGSDVVDTALFGAVFTVEDVQGEWIQITNTQTGFINRQDVYTAAEALPVLIEGGQKELVNNDNAVLWFNVAIALDPNNAQAHYLRGNALLNLQRQQEAVADLDIALSGDPNNSHAFLLRGICNYDLGQYELSVKDYDNALRIDPTYAVAYNNRGNSRERLDQNNLALTDYNEAIRLVSDDPMFFNNRGVLFQKMKQYAKAVADYNQAISLDSSYMLAYRNRGLTFQDQGDLTRAVADFRQVVDLDAGEYNQSLLTDALALQQRQGDAVVGPSPDVVAGTVEVTPPTEDVVHRSPADKRAREESKKRGQ